MPPVRARRKQPTGNNQSNAAAAPCQHPMVIGSLCAVCGKVMPVAEADEGSRGLDTSPADAYSSSSTTTTATMAKITMVGGATIVLSQEGARQVHADKAQRLRAARKLSLVLDLDNTLLHATPDVHAQTYKADDVFAFQLPGVPGTHCVKLRPHLREFLARAAQRFELTIYTAGTRRYAELVAAHLDPDNSLFARRIISATDTADLGRSTKSLSRIFPGATNMVLVVDDREDVWRGEQAKNLVLVRPYMFWKPPAAAAAEPAAAAALGAGHDGGATSPAVENDPQLLCTLAVLTAVHDKFYASNGSTPAHRDASALLAEVRRAVLRGARLVFTGLIPLQTPPHTHALWRYATALGAAVDADVTPATTHVVAAQMGSEKTVAGLRTRGCVVVHVDWVMFCFWHCRREDERMFLLAPGKWAAAAAGRQRSLSDAHVARLAEQGEGGEGGEDSEGPTPKKRARLDATDRPPREGGVAVALEEEAVEVDGSDSSESLGSDLEAFQHDLDEMI
ncbi:hypothetical protein JKP88DRAFT_300447 [Tribonema minus]|uniref:protein-serine/threonine phosphatase n=1 Tax=Tribonema minus TaxID=303371 RepID=A0A836CNJ6_9STRA|nr:hypothetical protein JKP88DRAFT_300447 [Tribonema minus]